MKLLLALSWIFLSFAVPSPQPRIANLELRTCHQFPCKVIKNMIIPHCKKGPEACKKCKKNKKAEWCLLNVCPEKQGEVQRPVTAVKFHGQDHMREYEVIQKFKSEEEARKYGADNKVEVQ